jgi:hypothetical protein
MAEIFQIVRSEHVAAEGDTFAELSISTNQMFDSLPVPSPSKKKKMTGREDCEMLEEAFTILTSLAAAIASAHDDECRSCGTSITNKSRNYLPRTRNKVQHELSSNIHADDQGLFVVSYPVSNSSPDSHVYPTTTPSSAAGLEDLNMSDLMCL